MKRKHTTKKEANRTFIKDFSDSTMLKWKKKIMHEHSHNGKAAKNLEIKI